MSEEIEKTEEITLIGDRYLRRRPFLIVNSVQRPVRGAVTTKKNPPMQRFEQPTVVDRVTDKHLREAEVIIDILNRTIVKSRFSEVATGEQVVDSFLEKYAEIVSEGVTVYARRMGMAEGLAL